jgi:hypothetical protein
MYLVLISSLFFAGNHRCICIFCEAYFAGHVTSETEASPSDASNDNHVISEPACLVIP